MKFVYFMKPVGERGPIKIGCSKVPQARLRSVEIWSPSLLEIAAMAEGAHREENILHQMFGDARLHGEWFAASDRLMQLIEFVQRAGKLPPLDYSLNPYETGKSSMTRRCNPKVRQDKHDITSKIMRAERRAYGFNGHEFMRPVEVHEIIQSYQGFAAPLPTKAQMAVVQKYIDHLSELPDAPRDFRAWLDWHQLILKAA